MTGLLVVPRREDFDRIDSGISRRIYSEVAFAGQLPEIIKSYYGL